MIPKYDFKLLPNRFKKIGIAIILITPILLIIIKVFNIYIDTRYSKYLKDFFLNGIILGMFAIAFSKEKMEDERVKDFRYKSMAAALLFGILYTIIRPFISLFVFKDSYEVLSAQELMMVVLGIYLISFSAIRHENPTEE